MDFTLSAREKAQKYWVGFLCKTWLECKESFTWLAFEIKHKCLVATGTKTIRGVDYKVKIRFSPFLNGRFERVFVQTKNLIMKPDTHFNGDGSLCLYHPILDLKDKSYMELKDIIPWISEWLYYYDKYLEYKVWLGPEHPHSV